MATEASVLLIEDDHQAAQLIATSLRTAPEPFQVAEAATAGAGLTHLGEKAVDCVLLDYLLPDFDGLVCLEHIRRCHPSIPVIMLTGAGSERVAVEAMKRGAADYLVKHGRYVRNVPAAIREAISRTERAPQPPVEFSPADTRSTRPVPPQLPMVASSPAMRHALALAHRASRCTATVLLEGETGTGKDIFARAIHRDSSRRSGPFVALNCAALPETLLESELFGVVRGAFTGADRERRGLFDEANHGTLFLDEVGEMSLAMQAKLLRVLEDGKVRPVGSSHTRSVDARVIAATNRDLDAAAREGTFRRDLYYRLKVFPICLPPLRERGDDVATLALAFLQWHGDREGRRVGDLSPDALRLLRLYSWPGNVRELSNEMHRVVLSANEGVPITPDLLSPSMLSLDVDRPLKEIVRDIERATIRARLERFAYRRSATAQSLGITREALWAKLRHLGVNLPRGGRRVH